MSAAPLRIVWDATGFQNFQTGVGRYAYNLITHAVPVAGDIHFTILVSHTLQRTHPIVRFAEGHSAVEITPIRSPVIGPKRDLRFLFSLPPYHLYHCLNSNLPLFLNRATVVTLHDLIYLKHPQFLGRFSGLKRRYLDMLFSHIATRASHIIAVSRSTADDFRKRYQRVAGRSLPLSVVYEASAPQIGASTRAPSHGASVLIDLERPFFFYYGELRPHKNVERLLRAFALFRAHQHEAHTEAHTGAHTEAHTGAHTEAHTGAHTEAHTEAHNVELIIAGAPHPTYRLPDPLPAGVRYLGAINEGILTAALPRALALCFVSLYEGFGLPILEAMQCGTPVICSNISSMPEVAGQAALLVDPRNEGDIARAMDTIYTDQRTREHYISLGRARARQFNWDTTARQTLQIYRSLL